MAVSADIGKRVSEYLNALEDIRYIHTEKFEPAICLCPQHKECNWAFLESQLMLLSIPEGKFTPTSDHMWYYTRFTVYFKHVRVPNYAETFMSSSIFEIINYLTHFIRRGVKGSRMWEVTHVQCEYYYTKGEFKQAPELKSPSPSLTPVQKKDRC